MRLAFALLSAVVLCSLPHPSQAWGVKGHATVAKVASDLLSDAARNGVLAVLGADGDMESVASFMDTLKPSSFADAALTAIGALLRHPASQAKQKMAEWTKPLHFANADDQCKFDEAKNCKNGQCASAAIKDWTSRLKLFKGTTDAEKKEERKLSLKFLIHVIGDLAQPLHAGKASDRGGNSIEGTFMGTKVNLHRAWDDNIVDKHVADDYGGDVKKWQAALLAKIKTGAYKDKRANWIKCKGKAATNCPEEWAQHSASLACTKAYKDTKGNDIAAGFDLKEAYYKAAVPVVDEQIARGAVQLAHTLEQLYGAAAGAPKQKSVFMLLQRKMRKSFQLVA